MEVIDDRARGEGLREQLADGRVLGGELVGARTGARGEMGKQQPEHDVGEPLREPAQARRQTMTGVLAGQQREQSIVALLRGRLEALQLAVVGTVHAPTILHFVDRFVGNFYEPGRDGPSVGVERKRSFRGCRGLEGVMRSAGFWPIGYRFALSSVWGCDVVPRSWRSGSGGPGGHREARADGRGLTPLFWMHVLPYGEVNLDMTSRLNLAQPARLATADLAATG